MKTKQNALLVYGAAICGLAVKLGTISAHAEVLNLAASNTNNVNWSFPDVNNTDYNNTGDLFDALNLSVTVSGGAFTFQDLDLYLGWSGGGSGGAPSPYLQILDGSGNVVATTTPMTLTTSENAFYGGTSQAAFAPYLTSFYAGSSVILNPGTYAFEIFDTGEQLNSIYAGAASGPGVSVTAGAPYQNYPVTTPAFVLYGSSPVPEPSTYALLASGLAGCFMLKRRALKS